MTLNKNKFKLAVLLHDYLRSHFHSFYCLNSSSIAFLVLVFLLILPKNCATKYLSRFSYLLVFPFLCSIFAILFIVCLY